MSGKVSVIIRAAAAFIPSQNEPNEQLGPDRTEFDLGTTSVPLAGCSATIGTLHFFQSWQESIRIMRLRYVDGSKPNRITTGC